MKIPVTNFFKKLYEMKQYFLLEVIITYEYR